MDLLHRKLIANLQGNPLPSLSGAIWYEYSKLVPEHPMAMKVIPQRDPKILNFVGNLQSTLDFHKLIEDEVALGQKHGLIRQDIHVPTAMASARYIATHLLFPLIFEQRYLSEEWLLASNVLIGNGFYPMPDFSSLEKIKEFEWKVAELGFKILEEQNQKLSFSPRI